METLFSSPAKTNIKLFTATAVLIVNFILSFSVNLFAQQSDTTAPNIIEFSFTPLIIDTTNGSQSVMVTIRAADAGNGVSGLSVFFAASEGRYQGVPLHIDNRNRISGDSKDGVYKATVIFPQYSRVGTWLVNSIFVFDGVNRKFIYNSELAASGFVTNFRVISNEDSAGPEISQFSITPSTIDISRSSQVVITVRVKDALSGVNNISVSFGRREDGYSYSTELDAQHRISGDENDGVYRIASRPFYYSTGTGTYYAHISASDKISNSSSLTTNELIERGYSSQLEITQSEPSGLVFISGRVLTPEGKAVPRAIVTLTDAIGIVRYATTNPFGYYRFNQVRVLRSYSLRARSKNKESQPQTHFIDHANSNLDFTVNVARQ